MSFYRTLSRRVLFGLATNGALERIATALPAVESRLLALGRRYVAGKSMDDAIAKAGSFSRRGFGVSVDFFGEAVGDARVASEARARYVELARAIARLPPSVWLALDLSHLGLDVSEAFCLEQLSAVASALPSGRRIQVGAEDAARNPAIFRVVIQAARAGLPVTGTLQANLRRSTDDATALIEAGVPIRLVKGAYVEPASVALPWGEHTDLAYLRLAHYLRDAGAEFAIATHDPILREALLADAPRLSVEMLLGVRGEDADALLARNVPTRVYVPFGERWFRYWARRIAESRGAA